MPSKAIVINSSTIDLWNKVKHNIISVLMYRYSMVVYGDVLVTGGILVVFPPFAVETSTVACLLAIELSSIVLTPFAVETPVVAFSLGADACSPSCGETLVSVILHSLSPSVNVFDLL